MDKFIKTNYHTHTTWCDGKNTVEQMAKAAFDSGFSVFGFSGHSMYPFSSKWHMQSALHTDYCRHVRLTAGEYKGKMEVLLGFEADYISGICCPKFSMYEQFKPDFLIGSVHYIPGKDTIFNVDGNGAATRENIQKNYGGNAREAVCAYFAMQKEMLKKGDFTFIGHCDLFRIQNSPKFGNPLFSEQDSWYRSEIKAFADAIASSGVCVEINTGAMSRGYMDSPYPSQEFLELLHQRNVPVTINSDSHAQDTLDFAFDKALDAAKKAGYTELAYYSADSLKFQKIQ